MIDTSGNKPVIQVKMFGGFTITMDDKSMGDSDNRSRKAWNLLSYLVINRRKDVSINELFQAIWQDGMQDNPYGALKTLVFRVRKMMEAAGFPSQDLILNQKGAYMWNPSWELSIDTASHTVKVSGEEVSLTPKEFDLLVFLASNKGIALSREKILQKVWNYDYFGEDRTVDTHVKMLRGHLGKCRGYIATVWGIGYKFDPDAAR